MRSPKWRRAAVAVMCFVVAGLVGAPAFGQSGPTTVHNGSVTVGDAVSDLDLSGNIVYAIDTASETDRVIGGVTFKGTNVPGTPITGYTQTASNADLDWGSYNIGVTADDDNLESLLRSINCCNAGGAPGDAYNFAVAPGLYQIQFLWGEKNTDSGNDNTRVWDVLIEGQNAVDDVNVVGLLNADGSHVHPDGGGADNQFTIYTAQANVTDGTLNVNFGGTLIGTQPGNDRNYVLSGIIVELVPEPTALGVLALGAVALLRRGRRRAA